MNAATIAEFGAIAELTDVPTPEPAPGEVRVRVHAASINNIDLAIANGLVRDMMEHRFPLIPGQDFAGVVDTVGSDVSDYEPGDRVFGIARRAYFGEGTFAEYVTVPTASGIAKLPEAAGFAEGAALGVAAATASTAIELAEITTDDTVFVIGATGGVGTIAVQLAKRAGAKVFATAATDEGRALVTRHGADATIDHTADPAAVAQAVRDHAPDGVDVIVHLAGDRATAAAHAKSGGRLVSPLAHGLQPTLEDLTVHNVHGDTSNTRLAALAELLAQGDLAVEISRSFDLAHTADALASFAGGNKLGKVVITVP